MASLIYQTKTGKPWNSVDLNLTDNEVQEQCLKQKRLGYAKYNTVKITDGKISIKASSIMFSSGDIWDAAESKFV